MNLLILLLFALCAQNAASVKKKKTGNRLIKGVKVGLGLLAFSTLALNIQQKETNALLMKCPTTLPLNSLLMMNYIRCGKEDSADFLKFCCKEEHYDNKCPIIKKEYEKTKFQKCWLGDSVKVPRIVKGAIHKILGRDLSVEDEKEMFEEYLLTLNGIEDEIGQLYDEFAKLKKPNFFQVMKAIEYTKMMYAAPKQHIKEALNPKYQTLDFDKVDRMLPYAQLFFGVDATDYYRSAQDKKNSAEEALDPKYQSLDFDKVDRMLRYAEMMYYEDSTGGQSSEAYNNCAREALDPKYHSLDFDKVDRMREYAEDMFPVTDWNYKEPRQKQAKEALNPKYQLYNFDNVDFLYKLLKKYSNGNLIARTKALSQKFKTYDISRVYEMYYGLKSLFPHKDSDKLNAEEALEDWIQTSTFDINRVKEIFKKCQDKQTPKQKKNCWNLNKRNLKQDLYRQEASRKSSSWFPSWDL